MVYAVHTLNLTDALTAHQHDTQAGGFTYHKKSKT